MPDYIRLANKATALDTVPRTKEKTYGHTHQ